MTRVVQHRRGTTDEHAIFTGAVGEITVDTTKKTAVIHDGETEAGFPLAREDLGNTTAVLSSMIRNVVVLWQSQYDAIVNKDRFTLYIVTPITLDANDTLIMSVIGSDSEFYLI